MKDDMDTSYGAAEFKAHCLRVIDEVAETGREVRVTKRGKPLVRVVPEEAAETPPVYGFLSGSVHITGDITGTGESWDADKD